MQTEEGSIDGMTGEAVSTIYSLLTHSSGLPSARTGKNSYSMHGTHTVFVADFPDDKLST